MDWFRMWHGMPNDDKLRVVARKSKQPMAFVVAVWSYLLDYASQQEQRGSIAGIDLEAVAVGLDMEEDVVSSIFFCLEEKERIKNGRITSWEKLQPKREDSSSRPTAEVWAKIRTAIFERDNFTCRYCGSSGVRLECDHVIPVSKGGNHDESNLVTACFQCNRGKRAKTLEEWGKELMPI